MIRLYEPSDRPAVQRIVLAGLLETATTQEERDSTVAHQTATLDRDLDDIDGAATQRWPRFNERYWVCVVDGIIVGGVGITRVARQRADSKEMVCLHRLSIDQQHRRHGHARNLLTVLECYVGEAQIRRIRLTTQENLAAAIQFYESMQYKRVARQRWDGLTLLKFEKRLN